MRRLAALSRALAATQSGRRGFLAAIFYLCLAGCSQGEPPSSRIQLAQNGLLSAALSPAGDRLFTGSFQHGGALWDQNEQGRLFDWNHDAEGYSAYHAADFSEDGRFVAVTDGSSVTIWDASSGEARLFLESPAQSLAIQNSLEIWQTSDGEAEAYWRKPARILDIAMSKQYLLLGLENQVALLVNLTDQTVIGALHHQDVITKVAMDDNARFAVTGSRGGHLTVWSLENGEKLEESVFTSPVVYADISPDGSSVLSVAEKGPVTLMSGATRQEIFRGNPGIVSAAFPDDGTILLGSSREKVWAIKPSNQEVVGFWQVPKQGPWHKAAIVALQQTSHSIQAIASDGFAYRLN